VNPLPDLVADLRATTPTDDEMDVLRSVGDAGVRNGVRVYVTVMSPGSRTTPLTDQDRWPWLRAIAAQIDTWRAQGKAGVVTCSALKRAYRDVLIGDRRGVRLVYLRGSHELIHRRLAGRHQHFMPIGLLDSQFATLEEPGPDERPIVVDVGGTPAEIVAEVIRKLGAVPKAPA